MLLKKLDLKNFRSYKKGVVEFRKGMNFIQGENGRGKTNLLEAVYYLGHLKSFRTSSIRDMIRWESDVFFLRGEVQYEEKEANELPESRRKNGILLEAALSQTGRKMKINATEVRNSSDYLGYLEVMAFLPESLSLIKGLPQGRRNFLDRGIFSLNHRYQNIVQQYQKVLQRKNYLLATNKGKHEALEVWNDQLVDLGSRILWERLKYIGRINETISRNLGSRTYGGPPPADWIRMFYVSSVLSGFFSGLKTETDSNLESLEDIQLLFSKKIRERRNEEIRRSLSLVGPHRDDLVIQLRGKDLKRFGSQGEQRLSLFLIILAMVFDFKKERGFYPILLLDDLISELDNKRRDQALHYFPKDDFQVFLTSAENISLELLWPQVYRLDISKIQN